VHRSNRLALEDPLKYLPKLLTKLYSCWVRIAYPFASIGTDVSFHFMSKLSRERTPWISIGNSVTVREHAWLNIATYEPTGDPILVIEDNCVIAVGSILSAKNGIHLERDVNVAQQVLIMDHNHGYEDVDVPVIRQDLTGGGTIRIGEGSWIGHGAAILCSRGELTIGRHCVVSANSVVMQSLPDYSVAFGIPAKVIRQYDPETQRWRIGQLKSNGADRATASRVGAMKDEAKLVEQAGVLE